MLTASKVSQSHYCARIYKQGRGKADHLAKERRVRALFQQFAKYDLAKNTAVVAAVDK